MPTTNTPAVEVSTPECLSRQTNKLDLRFGKSNRLLTPGEFKAVFDSAIFKASGRNLLLLAIPSDSTRLGLVVAKKHVRQAVQRNRLKRLLRESFRHHKTTLVYLDIVALVKPGLWQQDNGTIRNIIDAQWQNLLKQKNRRFIPATSQVMS